MKKTVVISVSLLIIVAAGVYTVQLLKADGNELTATFNALAMNVVTPFKNNGFWHTFVDWLSTLANNWAGLEASHLAAKSPFKGPFHGSVFMILLGIGLVGFAGFGRKNSKRGLPVRCPDTQDSRPTVLETGRIDTLYTCRLHCC